MCSNTRIATIDNAGNIKAAKAANGYVAITHKVQAPKPTVGMQAKPVYKQTIASNYTKYKDTKLLQATKATKVTATTSTGKSLITITDAQVKAKDESGFSIIVWTNFVFWTVCLLPIFITSFRKPENEVPLFWTLTSWLLPLLSYAIPMFFIIGQMLIG